MADHAGDIAQPYQPSEDALTLANRIHNREMSAREATEAAMERIGAVDGVLAAFCTLSDTALDEADALDRRLSRGESVGPFAGVPVAIKDLISTKGLRTTFGSPLYRDNVPEEDDIVVERLKQAGAIVIGKSNNSEFGYGPVGHNPLFPTTRNPWDTRCTPGGSSAGSATAVASGMVAISLGSDGGGSIRIPASLTGTFGIKPSWGRVPLYPGCRNETEPGASGWESLEHIGPITRTVKDAALMMSVISGPSQRDRHSLPNEGIDWLDLEFNPFEGAKLAFSPDLGFARVEPEVCEIAQQAARTLAAALGARLVCATPEIGDVQSTFEALVALDTDRAGLRRMAEEQDHHFSGPLAAALDTQWTADMFTRAIMERKRVANVMWRFMREYALLITPSTSAVAFPVDMDGPEEIAGARVSPSAWTPFSVFANLTGQPSASIPAGFTQRGHPVGFQITGRRLDDLGVLRAAAAFERAQPWSQLWPALATRERDFHG